MLGREILIASTSALVARAFLVPAGIASPPALGDLSVYDPTNQIIRLPCSACVFTYEHNNERIEETSTVEDTFWIQGGANDVIVNLSVSPKQVLEVNGRPIYPFENFLSVAAGPLRVIQSPASASDEEIAKGSARSASLEVTGSGMAIESEATMDTGDTFTTVRLTLLEVETQELDLDDILISLLSTAHGDLLILDAQMVHSVNAKRPHFSSGLPVVPDTLHPAFPPPRPSAGMDDARESKCGHLPGALCRLINTVESKMAGLKSLVSAKKPGCHGGRRPSIGHVPGHIKPSFLRNGAPTEVEDYQEPQPPHPPSGRHHRHHFHGHHHRHSFLRSVVHGFFAVVVPTLAGVVVGMSISVVGLLIVRFLSFLWQSLALGRRADYVPVALGEPQAPVDDVKKDEKDCAIDDETCDVLPQYEEAPSYVQATGEQ